VLDAGPVREVLGGMNRIVLPLVALLSLSTFACAGEAADDADVAVDTQLAPEAFATGTDTNAPATIAGDAVEKGKDGGKGSTGSGEAFLIVKMSDVLISSY
jgi:hypothetical protein